MTLENLTVRYDTTLNSARPFSLLRKGPDGSDVTKGNFYKMTPATRPNEPPALLTGYKP